MSKTGPKLTAAQRTEVKDRVWRLLVTEKLTQTEIAERIREEYGIELSQSMISRYRKRASEEVTAGMTEFISQVKAEQTATLEYITRESLEAWVRSKHPRDDDGDERGGSTTYLREARAAMAEIRQIWGLDEPERLDVTSGGEALLNADVMHEIMQLMDARRDGRSEPAE